MYCKNCGRVIDDDSKVCCHCGCKLNEIDITNTQNTEANNSYQGAGANYQAHTEKKTGLGVVCGLFLGLVGLIIGLMLYPDGTISRKTFMKGWMIAFFVELGVSLILTIVGIAVSASIVPYCIGL